MFSLSRFVTIALILLMIPAWAQAQIYVDTGATGAGDGTSWADAYPDLQDAIDAADGSSEIWIAEGIYTPDSEGDSFTITGAKDGVKIYGGFDGTETARSQRDPSEHRSILSGDINGDDVDPDGDGIIESSEDIAGEENANHVLLLDGISRGPITRSTVLDGVTVTAGDADGPFPESIGGGLLCDGDDSGNACSPILRTVWFAGNRSSNDGGAIYNSGLRGGAASPRIAEAQFSGNAAGENGGALVNKGFDDGASNPTITNTTFSNNTAVDDGGAVYNEIASPTMINVGFVDNSADRRGGAIGTLGGSPSIANAVFTGNSAVLDGGAIYNEADPFQSSNLTVTNATVVGNTAGREGGAIFNLGVPASTGPDPTPAKATLTNTILWDNSAATGEEVYGGGENVAQTFTHTIVQGGAGGIVDEDGASTTYLDESGSDVSFANSTNLNADPQFVDATSPAGPDGVIGTEDDGTAIPAGSPAIEGGDTDALPSDATDLDDDGDTQEPLPVDLTGAARVQDSDLNGTATVDIGAYETESRPVAITGGGFGGLKRTFRATPGRADQPIGVVRLKPSRSGADLTEVVVTLDAPGAAGVDGASLWISDDNQFDASGDAEIANLNLDPQTDLPSLLTFGGFSEPLQAEARYLFVAVTLTGEAEGTVNGYLADQTALALEGGAITTVNGNEQTGFSTLLLSAGASPLPVEMAAFEGTRVDGGVRLRWRTASEENNAGFRVQRRAENGSWTSLRFVEGAGTTSEPQRYRFTDTDLPYAADTLRYRLKQVDTDGTASLSDPVTIVRGGPDGLTLLGTAPNPVRQRATVRYGIPEAAARGGEATLQLYDVMGRQVRSIQLEGEAGRHERRLDVSGLASGMYLLRLRAAGEVRVQKLTVIN